MVGDERNVDLRLWGKSKGLVRPYPLVWHLVDTAAVVASLWDGFLTLSQGKVIMDGLGVAEQQARSLVMFWAGMHDVGKATPSFQAQVTEAYDALLADRGYGRVRGSGELRHDRAAQVAVRGLLRSLGYAHTGRTSKTPCYRVAQMLGGHHGRFQETTEPAAESRLLGEGRWAEQRAALVGSLHQAVGCPAPPQTVGGLSAVLITGLIILADWLASQEHFLSRQLTEVQLDGTATMDAVTRRLAALVPQTRELLTEAGLGHARLRPATFDEMFSFPPNALQRSVVDELLPQVDGPGLLVVTAATGDGKTETALVAAGRLAEVSGANGFFFALPTMATSDQMHRRVRRFVAGIAVGLAPVTLLHSMSWLNVDYNERSGVVLDQPAGVTSEDAEVRVVAPDWLRGRKRGLLASLSVGTVDQALLAALTTKHNSLRLLGLSGKVFVVDEAHAYDEYMQALLRQLLSWLGAAGCPVVLLSATLPSTQAVRLVEAYRQGAGAKPGGIPRVEYPGWLFVPASPNGNPVAISTEAREAVVAGRQIGMNLRIRVVRHLDGAETHPLDRRAVVREELAGLVEQGGCAAVVCNTVDEAQRTFEVVRDWVAGRVEVVLLHSRFPARRREEITDLVTNRLGKGSVERASMIVVATQVIEQSLDLDVDLLISDLAPMAQLLQRAGRCHRHARPRPAWARQPCLVVLDPHDGDGYRKPSHWGEVYEPYLLRTTHLRLAGLTLVRVPEDVPGLMDAVYVTPPPADDPVLVSEHIEYWAKHQAERSYAELGLIPLVRDLKDLAEMNRRELSETQASTRLGADSVRVVCCYLDPDGGQWLDPDRSRPLPSRGARGDGRFTSAEVRAILSESIPMREQLIDGYDSPVPLPESWRTSPWLNELRPIWFTLGPQGPAPAQLGGRQAWLTPDLGLVIRRPRSHGVS